MGRASAVRRSLIAVRLRSSLVRLALSKGSHGKRRPVGGLVLPSVYSALLVGAYAEGVVSRRSGRMRVVPWGQRSSDLGEGRKTRSEPRSVTTRLKGGQALVQTPPAP